LFGLAEIFADSGKKGIGALHLLQKEQFPGIASNQPGADLQILDIFGMFWEILEGWMRDIQMVDFKTRGKEIQFSCSAAVYF